MLVINLIIIFIMAYGLYKLSKENDKLGDADWGVMAKWCLAEMFLFSMLIVQLFTL